MIGAGYPDIGPRSMGDSARPPCEGRPIARLLQDRIPRFLLLVFLNCPKSGNAERGIMRGDQNHQEVFPVGSALEFRRGSQSATGSEVFLD